MFSDTSEDSVEQRDFDSPSESYSDSGADDGRDETTDSKSRRTTLLMKAKEGKIDRYEHSGMMAFRRLEFALLVRFKTLDNAFTAIDMNSNGRISMVEWLKALGDLKIKGISLPVAKLSFNTMCRYRSCNEISATDLKAFCFNQSKCWKYLSNEAKSSGARVDRIIRHFRRRIADRFDTVREAFRAMDYNEDHEMEYNEFLAALDQWGLRAETPTRDIRFLFDALDIDGNGKLSWLEFEHFFQKQALDDVNRRGLSNRVVHDLKKFEERCLSRFSSMETAFSIMDVNCDQQVVYQEFLTALRRWELPDDEIDHLWNIIDFKYLGKVSLRDLRRLLFRVRFQEGRAPRVSPPRRTRVSLPYGVSYAGIDEQDPEDREVAADMMMPPRDMIPQSPSSPTLPPDDSTPKQPGDTAPVEAVPRSLLHRSTQLIPNLLSPPSLSLSPSPKSMRDIVSPASALRTTVRPSAMSSLSTKGRRSTAGAAAKRKKKPGTLERKTMSLGDLRRHWKATNVDLKATYDNGPPEVLQTLLAFHTPTNRITPAHKKKMARMALQRSPRPWTHLLPRQYTEQVTTLLQGARPTDGNSATPSGQGTQSITRLRELKMLAREHLCEKKKPKRSQLFKRSTCSAIDLEDGLESTAIDVEDGRQSSAIGERCGRLTSNGALGITSPGSKSRDTDSSMSQREVRVNSKKRRDKNIEALVEMDLRDRFATFAKGMEEEREYVGSVVQSVEQKNLNAKRIDSRKERYGSKWNAQTSAANRLRKKCKGAAKMMICFARDLEERKNVARRPRPVDGTSDSPVGKSGSRLSVACDRSEVQQEINAQLDCLAQGGDASPHGDCRTAGQTCDPSVARLAPFVEQYRHLADSTVGLMLKVTRENHMKAVGSIQIPEKKQVVHPSDSQLSPKQKLHQRWSSKRPSQVKGEKDLVNTNRANARVFSADKWLAKQAEEAENSKAPGALTLKFRAAILEAGMLRGRTHC
eukprot:GEMP01003805.1.p1 GENE.GEMP01003805.1~~GEMP01003805.1.p1  ORF type:complete len:978 (+),score=254.61 GEMP01003805.1:760-3693(+)